jgi:hypothetical protein
MQELLERMARLEAAAQAAERRRRYWQAATVVLVLLALPLLLARGGGAQGGKPALEARIAADTALQNNLTAEATTRTAADTALQGQITPLAEKRVHVSVLNNDIFITGANLHLLNGEGGTETTNGLGNLIIGYNENILGYPRTGSHNLVVGEHHGWESFGGLVAGQVNRITGPFASVSGGFRNTASGLYASVNGGTYITQSSDVGWSAGGNFNPVGGIGAYHSP